MTAEKDFAKLEKIAQKRIRNFLREGVQHRPLTMWLIGTLFGYRFFCLLAAKKTMNLF